MTGSLELEAAIPVGRWSPELGRPVTVADLLAATPFDASDRPSAGTGCAACRLLEHYCPAKGYCGEYPLCLACGSGSACEQMAAVERFRNPTFEDEEMFERDAHNAPREGRVLEISDADRVVPAERPLTTAWTAKATLDPENLKKGLKRSTRVAVPLGPKAARQDRSLAKRILRMRVAPLRAAKTKEVQQESVMANEVEAKVVRVYAPRVCVCGCGESYVPNGVRQQYKEGHKPAAAKRTGLGRGRRKKLKAAKRSKPAELVTVAALVADPAEELVTVRIPVSALDRLLLLLPAKVKVSAMEKLLGELGSR